MCCPLDHVRREKRQFGFVKRPHLPVGKATVLSVLRFAWSAGSHLAYFASDIIVGIVVTSYARDARLKTGLERCFHLHFTVGKAMYAHAIHVIAWQVTELKTTGA